MITHARTRARHFAIALPLYLASASAMAQQAPAPPAQPATPAEPISALMFFTFGAALLIAVGLLAWFMRKKSNRDAMK